MKFEEKQFNIESPTSLKLYVFMRSLLAIKRTRAPYSYYPDKFPGFIPKGVDWDGVKRTAGFWVSCGCCERVVVVQ